MRFVHLPGLTVPVILGRNFMSKTGIAVDIGMGGYREPPLMSLVPFAEPPAVAEPTRAAPERRAGGTPVNAPGREPPAGRPLVAAAEERSREERIAELRALLANACELSTPEQDRVLSLLGEFKEMFTERPGCTNLVQHGIDTGEAQPWKCNPRPVSPAKRQATDAALDELLKEGIIRRSTSPWGFPVVLVRKKDGSWRLCVDYRRLNAVTQKDAYPFPNVDEIVSNLGGAGYFSILDASKGYLQVEMRQGDECKTAFTCHRGLYEFVRMPFGLCGSPSTFQRLIDRVLGDAKWQHALAYLDDIVVYSRTFEEHLSHLREGGGNHTEPIQGPNLQFSSEFARVQGRAWASVPGPREVTGNPGIPRAEGRERGTPIPRNGRVLPSVYSGLRTPARAPDKTTQEERSLGVGRSAGAQFPAAITKHCRHGIAKAAGRQQALRDTDGRK